MLQDMNIMKQNGTTRVKIIDEEAELPRDSSCSIFSSDSAYVGTKNSSIV